MKDGFIFYLIGNYNWKIDKEYNLDKLLYLLVDRPDTTEEEYDEDLYWVDHNNLTRNEFDYHREYDLPACFTIQDDTVHTWEINGIPHREKGKPAQISDIQGSFYYLNGVEVTKTGRKKKRKY